MRTKTLFFAFSLGLLLLVSQAANAQVVGWGGYYGPPRGYYCPPPRGYYGPRFYYPPRPAVVYAVPQPVVVVPAPYYPPRRYYAPRPYYRGPGRRW
ncbi:hypothetical protein IC235_01525 [Hymenobacter sp. BT664]|uniref:Spore coat protein n=1 Tax=Hymenobacter montanus TaxID=2771359 RepID=A0A927GHY5_9BACT|nr:hypothetical protein [Hymenobacter montanus]MBD2766569.1 hypothetical protein [Hymenobacter montanus]